MDTDYQRQSDNIGELMAAMNRAQLAMLPAKKDSENPFFHSKYADLATVWDALLPFRQEGLVFTQNPMESPDGYLILETQISHVSGQWTRSRLKMRVAKDDPQGYGSAITYGRRYALGAMSGLVTEVDDDGNAANHPTGKTYEQKFQHTPPGKASSAPLPEKQAQPPTQAPKTSPEPTAAQESTFIWQIGKTHGGKRIEEIPLDYLTWYVANGKKQDHLDACRAELIRVDNQQAGHDQPTPPLSGICEAYIEQIGLCETLTECQACTAQAMTDSNLNVFESTQIEEAGEKRLAFLRG